jgi:OmpA-OmpF porin, OOP family
MRYVNVLALVLLLTMFVAPVQAQDKFELIKKTDNFAFLVDHSGSMRASYLGEGPRIDQAKELLKRINAEIPELGYKGGLYTFAPAERRIGFETYSKKTFAEGIENIEAQYSRVTRATPIGRGFELIAPEVSPLSGKVDLIVVTDGGQNVGPEPMPIVSAMAKEKGDRLCIHVISYARTAEERALVQKLAKATKCSTFTVAEDLADDKAVQQYVENIFYERRKVAEAPKPAPAPAPAPAPVVEEVIVLRGINFDFDKADIKPEFAPILDEAVAILKERQGVKVVVEGHTDWTGPEDYNQKLSERRAQSVKDYLVQNGIAADRLETKGFGESKPAYDNTTKEGRFRNRRVEFQVVK